MNLGGVCSYDPTSPQGPDELERKANLGNASSHDGSFTAAHIDYLDAKGIKEVLASTLSDKRVHLLKSERGNTMDTSWARAEAEMVEVQQNILKYPTWGTTTSFFPMYERALTTSC